MEDKLIEQLAWARYRLEGQQAEEQGLENELKVTEAGIRLDACWEEQSETRKVIADLEAQIKAEVAVTYDSTGEAHPHDAITVKRFIILEYDPALALAYCQVQLPEALKLDVRMFEKVAKVTKPKFVTERVEMRVQIATDLSRYVDAIDDAE